MYCQMLLLMHSLLQWHKPKKTYERTPVQSCSSGVRVEIMKSISQAKDEEKLVNSLTTQDYRNCKC